MLAAIYSDRQATLLHSNQSLLAHAYIRLLGMIGLV